MLLLPVRLWSKPKIHRVEIPTQLLQTNHVKPHEKIKHRCPLIRHTAANGIRSLSCLGTGLLHSCTALTASLF